MKENLVKKYVKTIHKNAITKGFWENPNSKYRQMCLIVSELSEAIEAHRKNYRANIDRFNERYSKDKSQHKIFFEVYIKDSIEDELTDAWIRIVDWDYYLNKINKIQIEFSNIGLFAFRRLQQPLSQL